MKRKTKKIRITKHLKKVHKIYDKLIKNSYSMPTPIYLFQLLAFAEFLANNPRITKSYDRYCRLHYSKDLQRLNDIYRQIEFSTKKSIFNH